mmetsp:Transcript_28691/g.39995  ORF Transcript_28691/g.39995 Transcript_28691/m.39995 type:complete len:275 (-) Transcript_28691:473-1297(-)
MSNSLTIAGLSSAFLITLVLLYRYATSPGYYLDNGKGPTPAQIERFIAYVDKDRDSKMSAHELAEYFIEVDEKSREIVLDKYWTKQVDEVLRKLEKEDSDLLSWDDVNELMQDSEVTHVIDDLRKRFDYADADADGMLSKAELLVLMVPELSDRRAEYFKSFEFNLMDKDGDSQISWEDYWKPGEGMEDGKNITAEDLQQVEEKERRLWNNCDRDGDGKLSPEEYFVFATVQWSFHEVSYALNADQNGDQHITKNEMLANLDVFTSTLTYHDEL